MRRWNSEELSNSRAEKELPLTDSKNQEPIITKVLNFSRKKLTQDQKKVMARGPKFCITTPGNFFDFQGSTRDFT